MAIVLIPLLIFFCLFDWQNHFAMSIFLFIMSAFAGLEGVNLLNRCGFQLKKPIGPILGSLLPILAYLENKGLLFAGAAEWGLTLTVLVILAAEALLHKPERIPGVSKRFPGYVFLIFYPGYLMTYIVRMASLPHSPYLYLLFGILVTGADGFGYIFGMIFGKGNRGVFVVSPKKSVAGLMGSFILTAAAGLVARYFLFIEIFSSKAIIVIALLCVPAAIIGDLFESALKRCADIKDAGKVFFGRGGVLDAFDSILFTAPVYYGLCLVFAN